VTKNGKQFGVMHIEDYSGKTELALFGDDYMRCKDYFVPGTAVFINGVFKTRWKMTDQFEFKAESICLLESIKRRMTKQLILFTEAPYLDENSLMFLENNLKKYPGKTSVKFLIHDPVSESKIGLNSSTGVEMNDELVAFLMEHPEFNISVVPSN